MNTSGCMIRLKNCAFFARHGVFSEEESLGQRFYVDADLDLGAHGKFAQDDIEHTVDYGKVFGSIERCVTGTRRYLIEALASDICRVILEEFALVEKVTVRVRKPNAPISGLLDHVEVEVSATRS